MKEVKELGAQPAGRSINQRMKRPSYSKSFADSSHILTRFLLVQYNTMQIYNKCSSVQSAKTWPTVHYNVSEYMG